MNRCEKAKERSLTKTIVKNGIQFFFLFGISSLVRKKEFLRSALRFSVFKFSVEFIVKSSHKQQDKKEALVHFLCQEYFHLSEKNED